MLTYTDDFDLTGHKIDGVGSMHFKHKDTTRSGVADFGFMNQALANGSGSILNQQYGWGYNVVDGGSRQVAAEPQLAYNVESYWQPGGYAEGIMEHYLAYGGSTTSPFSKRIWFLFIDRDHPETMLWNWTIDHMSWYSIADDSTPLVDISPTQLSLTIPLSVADVRAGAQSLVKWVSTNEIKIGTQSHIFNFGDNAANDGGNNDINLVFGNSGVGGTNKGVLRYRGASQKWYFSEDNSTFKLFGDIRKGSTTLTAGALLRYDPQTDSNISDSSISESSGNVNMVGLLGLGIAPSTERLRVQGAIRFGDISGGASYSMERKAPNYYLVFEGTQGAPYTGYQFDNQVLINTTTAPTDGSMLSVNGRIRCGGDIYITDSSKGLILTSPNGAFHFVTVDNSGVLHVS